MVWLCLEATCLGIVMPQKLAWLIELSFYLEASGESGRTPGVQELPYPPIHIEALAHIPVVKREEQTLFS